MFRRRSQHSKLQSPSVLKPPQGCHFDSKENDSPSGSDAAAAAVNPKLCVEIDTSQAPPNVEPERMPFSPIASRERWLNNPFGPPTPEATAEAPAATARTRRKKSNAHQQQQQEQQQQQPEAVTAVVAGCTFARNPFGPPTPQQHNIGGHGFNTTGSLDAGGSTGFCFTVQLTPEPNGGGLGLELHQSHPKDSVHAGGGWPFDSRLTIKVEGVRAGLPASRSAVPLRQGDMLLSVNGVDCRTSVIDDVAALIAQDKLGSKSLVFLRPHCMALETLRRPTREEEGWASDAL